MALAKKYAAKDILEVMDHKLDNLGISFKMRIKSNIPGAKQNSRVKWVKRSELESTMSNTLKSYYASYGATKYSEFVQVLKKRNAKSWKPGSQVEIYSNTFKNWYPGYITRFDKDDGVAWLTVEYPIEGVKYSKRVLRNEADKILRSPYGADEILRVSKESKQSERTNAKSISKAAKPKQSKIPPTIGKKRKYEAIAEVIDDDPIPKRAKRGVPGVVIQPSKVEESWNQKIANKASPRSRTGCKYEMDELVNIEYKDQIYQGRIIAILRDDRTLFKVTIKYLTGFFLWNDTETLSHENPRITKQ